MHFAYKFPHRQNKERKGDNSMMEADNKDMYEVHLTLFAATPDERQDFLIDEFFGKDIIDSGCSKTLNQSFFRFRDGVEVKPIHNM